MHLCALPCFRVIWPDVTSWFKGWHSARCAAFWYQIVVNLHTWIQIPIIAPIPSVRWLPCGSLQSSSTWLSSLENCVSSPMWRRVTGMQTSIYRTLSEHMKVGSTLRAVPSDKSKQRNPSRSTWGQGPRTEPLVMLLLSGHTIKNWTKFLQVRALPATPQIGCG